MRLITCEDCGKRYDFDRDEFCPRCGAFNHPANRWRVDSTGSVVRVDGINESNHAGSFSHREVHAEKAQRRKAGLDHPDSPKRTPPRPARGSPGAARRQEKPQSRSWVFWLVGFIVLVNFILPVLFAVFESIFG